MRRGFLLICVLMMLLLAGCGAGDQEAFLEEIRLRYTPDSAFTAKTAVRVEQPDRAADYVIDWSYDRGVSRLTVAEPEEIAGITVETSDQGLSFLYEDAVLTVDPAGAVLSPLEALPELLFGWSGGIVEDACRDTWEGAEAMAVSYSMERGGRTLHQRVWFDRGRYTPLYAEVYQDDRLTMRCTFLTFH